MLSDYQIYIAKIINKLEGRNDFAIAGGAALIIQKISDRQTMDIDYFTRDIKKVNDFAKKCSEAILKFGSKVNTLLENEGFVRLQVTKDDNQTIIDFGQEYYLATNNTILGLAFSEDELVLKKILALFHRAESRDGFDLMSLSKNNSIIEALKLVPQHDPGFDVSRFVTALKSLNRFRVIDTDFTKEQWEEVLEWSKSLIDEIQS